MSRTIRKKDKIIPEFVRTDPFNQRKIHRFYSDSFNHDGDKNPPKSFKRQEQRKFRCKVNCQVRCGEEVIPKDFRMPYYTWKNQGPSGPFLLSRHKSLPLNQNIRHWKLVIWMNNKNVMWLWSLLKRWRYWSSKRYQKRNYFHLIKHQTKHAKNYRIDSIDSFCRNIRQFLCRLKMYSR